MRDARVRIALVALMLAVFALPVQAEDETGSESGEPTFNLTHLLGWGVRFGVANDPDQVLAGVQFDMGTISDRVFAEPSIELGIGDDYTILKATAALNYRFSPRKSVRPYAGGGITLGIRHFDPPDRGSDTDVKLALRAIGGASWKLENRREFFIEGSYNFGSLHDFQLMLGWMF